MRTGTSESVGRTGRSRVRENREIRECRENREIRECRENRKTRECMGEQGDA